MDYEQNKTAQTTPSYEPKPEQVIYKAPEPKKDSGVGPVIGSIIIIILIVLGGLYFWGYVIHQKTNTENTSNQESATTDQDLNSISAELDSTNLDSTDTELDQIDAEIDAAVQ